MVFVACSVMVHVSSLASLMAIDCPLCRCRRSGHGAAARRVRCVCAALVCVWSATHPMHSGEGVCVRVWNALGNAPQTDECYERQQGRAGREARCTHPSPRPGAVSLQPVPPAAPCVHMRVHLWCLCACARMFVYGCGGVPACCCVFRERLCAHNMCVCVRAERGGEKQAVVVALQPNADCVVVCLHSARTTLKETPSRWKISDSRRHPCACLTTCGCWGRTATWLVCGTSFRTTTPHRRCFTRHRLVAETGWPARTAKTATGREEAAAIRSSGSSGRPRPFCCTQQLMTRSPDSPPSPP